MKFYNDRDKINAITILSKAAKLYEKYFCNKKLLVIHNNLISPLCIEAFARSAGFLHLTGLRVNEGSLLRDVPDNNANFKIVFFEKCLTGKITINDFNFDSKGEAELKLKVILNALTPQSNAKMLGDYNGQRLYFQSDKLMGSENSYLGLKKENGCYVVSSVINDDIRNDVEHIGISPVTSKIFMILSKGFSDACYNEIISISKYRGNKIDVQDLLKKISKDYAISQDLLFPDAPDDPPLKNKTNAGNEVSEERKEREDNSDNKEHEKTNEITNVSEIPKPQSGDKLEAPPKRLTLDEHLAQARAAKQTEASSLQKNVQSISKKPEESL